MADLLFMGIQAAMVIGVWSYLYKDNIVSKAVAEIVVSISTVYFFLSNYQNVINQAVMPIFTQGAILNIVPLILGLLLFARLVKGYGWLSSYSYAMLLGLGTGATLTTLVSGSIITRIIDTVNRPFLAKTLDAQLGGVICIIGVMFSLAYWIFTVEYKGPLQYTIPISRLFLMCSIGMLYAEDVLWAQSLFVGAATFVINFFKALMGIPF